MVNGLGKYAVQHATLPVFVKFGDEERNRVIVTNLEHNNHGEERIF